MSLRKGVISRITYPWGCRKRAWRATSQSPTLARAVSDRGRLVLVFKLSFSRALLVAPGLAAIVILCVTCCPGGSPPRARNAVPGTGGTPEGRRQLRKLACPESRPSIEIGCACAVAGDCAVALHFVDCCGSAVAIGIARSELAGFESKEKTCNPAAGSCQCVASPTRTSDGVESADPHEIGARCTGGVCVTFSRTGRVPPPPQPVTSAMPATEPSPSAASSTSCRGRHCAAVLNRSQTDREQIECVASDDPGAPPKGMAEGSVCYCNGVTDHCESTRVEKVPCKLEKDCWVSSKPVLHPIRRPQRVHHRFVPCVDGEVPPVCKEGFCAVGLQYGC